MMKDNFHLQQHGTTERKCAKGDSASHVLFKAEEIHLNAVQRIYITRLSVNDI